MVQNKELAYWVALADNPEIGAKTIFKLEKCFKPISKLFIPENLKKLAGINIAENIKKQIRNVVSCFNLTELSDKYRKLGIRPVSIRCHNYPKLLREIPDPPAVIFVRGKLDIADELNLAVVGSRKYSNYGKRVVQDIVRGIVQSNITIVSGMALGIDSIAHKATLDAHGRTIGVLANGLDQIYPSSNRALAEGIIANGGAVISEYPPGVPPYKYNFPMRNRIIAGMSLGILVAEAAQKSGTLLTAKSALDYNRELLAVPGSIYSPTSEGSNNLIKYGAKLVNSANDILSELNIESRVKEGRAKKIMPASREEAIIVDYLDRDNPIHIDILAKKSKIDIATLSSKLIFMEMKGMVKNIGANNYILL